MFAVSRCGFFFGKLDILKETRAHHLCKGVVLDGDKKHFENNPHQNAQKRAKIDRSIGKRIWKIRQGCCVETERI